MTIESTLLGLALLLPTPSDQTRTESTDTDSPRIVNIVNFVRGVEPRLEVDLLKPVVEQLALLEKYDLPGTFLLQYDAMIQPRFAALFKEELDERDELGGWFEVVQPMVEAAGLEWRGRFPWDWHSDVGFSVGYTPEEREKLVDAFMAKFEETFGHLPKSMGSWFMDAHTLAYLADRYGVEASCNCKDQIGTDGYTLWGGYWNQAFYPSRKNALMPAQTAEQQIPLPVFRMLGSDPIYQYDVNVGSSHQSVISLEPVYRTAGGDPRWVRWFFEELAERPCLAFGYAQVGQENSFGWPRMGDGLTDQLALLAELRKAGKVRVETLGDSGRWFAREHPLTPATAVVALSDWKGEGRKAIWYDSRFYRASLVWKGDGMRIRDLHLFDERYPERYLTERVATNACRYDTLPLLDGFSWSTADSLAGIRPVSAEGEPLAGGVPIVEARGETDLSITWPLLEGGALELRLEPRTVTIVGTGDCPDGWALELSWSPERAADVVKVAADAVHYRHNGFDYALRSAAGRFTGGVEERRIRVRPEGGRIAWELSSPPPK